MNLLAAPRSLYPLSRVLLVFALLVSFSAVAGAQVPLEPAKSPTDETTTSASVARGPAESSQTAPDATQTPANPGKSAEALQVRIERARALIAAHRLDTAASELESVRATARDNVLRNITSIMLMNVYLEEGNYGRAEALLEENYQARSAQKDESLATYFALAGQAVNGARTHLARYRSFGISTNDSSLPAEAVSDLKRLRSLLERMIAQAKVISSGRRTYDSLSLLEDVLGLRLSLAKDTQDQFKWGSDYASAREVLASSQTQIASLGGVPPLRGRSPVINSSSSSPYSTKRVPETPLGVRITEKTDSSADQQAHTSGPVGSHESKTELIHTVDNIPASRSSSSAGEPPVTDGGLLNARATKKVAPRYPLLARESGTAGLVRVHVVVDETGKVIAVSGSEGPMLLRTAAEEAARQWSFEAVISEGRPTRFSGYIDFNFSL